MAVRERGEGGSICVGTRHPPDPDAGGAENSIKPGRREKKSAGFGSTADPAGVLQLNNRRAKIRMSGELLRMGFSQEAVGRILNLDLNGDESV
jgi:hypothetical protein